MRTKMQIQNGKVPKFFHEFSLLTYSTLSACSVRASLRNIVNQNLSLRAKCFICMNAIRELTEVLEVPPEFRTANAGVADNLVKC
jgi:hypothetical protein